MTTINLFQNEKDTVTFKAGETIFEKGAEGDAMYAVKSGVVETVLDGQVLSTIEIGGIFGEMALVDHSPRSASAVAKTDCELVRIDEDRFQILMKSNPFFGLYVLRITVERLRYHMNA